MKIEVEIPDPKFQVGDVVFKKNDKNPKGLVLRIWGFEAKGVWSAKATPAHPEIQLYTDYLVAAGEGHATHYYCVLYDGYYDIPPDELAKNALGGKLRPGMVMTYDQLKFDAGSTLKLNHWKGEHLEPDNDANLRERIEAWDLKKAIKPFSPPPAPVAADIAGPTSGFIPVTAKVITPPVRRPKLVSI